MKDHLNQKPIPQTGPRQPPVRIHFLHPTATSVFVAGSFNGWNTNRSCLRRIGNGHWVGEFALAPGIHEYLLFVDGVWVADPSAASTTPNPFGGCNSVIEVPASHQSGHRADGMTLQVKPFAD